MPNVVMIAKSTYVWLEQLQRNTAATSIGWTRFLMKSCSLLADRGINALWLIGLWERSRPRAPSSSCADITMPSLRAYSL